MFASVTPTPEEIRRSLPGDEIIASPGVVMDRAFTLNATPEQAWPWFMQLGKNRGGWYFPRSLNWLLVHGSKGIWHIEPKFQDLSIGQIIDDWGGKDGYFEVAQIDARRTLVYKSTRGTISMSWAITLWPDEAARTRVIIRLRLSPVKLPLVARAFGGLIDWLTIAALASGLRQRLAAE